MHVEDSQAERQTDRLNVSAKDIGLCVIREYQESQCHGVYIH